MQKNTGHEGKVNQLTELLNENIKNGVKLNKVRITLISIIIIALLRKVESVSFHKLALPFDATGKADSSLRRLQRYIADFDLCGDLIARLFFRVITQKIKFKACY